MTATVQEIAPRVLRYQVGQELGVINGSPVKYDGIPSGVIRAERSGGWRDFQPELRRILPSGVQGLGIWGPSPDPWQTEDAGSYRVWAGYCPAAFMEQHTNESVAAGWAWVRDQTARGCHYAHWLRPADDPHYLGFGYSRADNVPGGFHERYSQVLPELDGVPYGPSGSQVPHAQHGTIDALVWYALIFNSYTAIICACGQWQAMASDLYAGGHGAWNSRAFGWFFRASAYLHELARVHEQYATGLCPVSTEAVVAAIDKALGHLAERNKLGCPVPKANEHMGAIESESTFFTGILLTGLLDVLEIVGGRAGLHEQIDVALTFLSSCLRPDGFFDDDRAPVDGGRLFGLQSVKGVQARFIVPGLLRVGRLIPSVDYGTAWALPIIQYCDSEGWWGGHQDRGRWAAEVGLASEGAP